MQIAYRPFSKQSNPTIFKTIGSWSALVRARLLSLLEIACEGAPAASAERGSCGELMEHSSGPMLEVTTGMAIDARPTTRGGRGSVSHSRDRLSHLVPFALGCVPVLLVTR